MNRNIVISILVALANVYDGDVSSAVKTVAANISEQELIEAQAKQLKNQMDSDVIVNELFTILLKSDDPNTKAACNRLLLNVKPFPFAEIISHFQRAQDSRDRAYSLHLLNLGAANESEIETLKSLATTALNDEGLGMKRYGEARAYSVEGKRVCEVAYNILVSRLGIESSFKLIDVDNLELHQRDKLIERLRDKLGVRAPSEYEQSTNAERANETFATRATLGNQTGAPKLATQSTSEPPRKSRIWLVWLLVVIAAAVGANWVFFKKRK